MTDHTPEAIPLRTRTLLHMPLDDDEEDGGFIAVDHVYLPEGGAGTCCACDNPAHDPGAVGLIVSEGQAILSAEQALVLAHQITRAASLILESEEEPPDIEREAAARFAAHDQDAPEGER